MRKGFDKEALQAMESPEIISEITAASRDFEHRISNLKALTNGNTAAGLALIEIEVLHIDIERYYLHLLAECHRKRSDALDGALESIKAVQEALKSL